MGADLLAVTAFPIFLIWHIRQQGMIDVRYKALTNDPRRLKVLLITGTVMGGIGTAFPARELNEMSPGAFIIGLVLLGWGMVRGRKARTKLGSLESVLNIGPRPANGTKFLDRWRAQLYYSAFISGVGVFTITPSIWMATAVLGVWTAFSCRIKTRKTKPYYVPLPPQFEGYHIPF